MKRTKSTKRQDDKQTVQYRNPRLEEFLYGKVTKGFICRFLTCVVFVLFGFICKNLFTCNKSQFLTIYKHLCLYLFYFRVQFEFFKIYLHSVNATFLK